MLIAPLSEESMFRGLLLGGLNLALPLLGHSVANGLVLALAGLPDLAVALLAHPVSFGIPGVSFLALGTFLLPGALRAAPLPSLTMEAP